MAGGEAETTSRLHAAGSFPSVILPSTWSRVQIGKCLDGGYERTFRTRTADGRSIRSDSRLAMDSCGRQQHGESGRHLEGQREITVSGLASGLEGFQSPLGRNVSATQPPAVAKQRLSSVVRTVTVKSRKPTVEVNSGVGGL